MTSTLIPALFYLATTQILFGLVCFYWGYFKGRDYDYIEIKGKKEETK
jgi:hypothetical protein